MTTHTVQEALDRFTLTSGTAGSDADREACVMSAVSWIAGEPWSDHPECTHHLLTRMAINAFDHGDTTDAERTAMLRDGAEALIGTADIPDPVIVWCMARGNAEAETPFGRAMACLAHVTEWRRNGGEPDLRWADLRWADLRWAELTRANLYMADLTMANLYGANLTMANLYGANLTAADLTRAKLTRANLTRAKLTGANLNAADLTRAKLYRAKLTGANLNAAKGTPIFGVPAGWKLDADGLWVRS